MESYRDTLRTLGARARTLRLLQNLRQAEVAARAGVGVMTVLRFEKAGQASLASALRIAAALGAEAGFEALFQAPPFRTLDEALLRATVVQRRRAPRRP
jgi:transcriptional regulator with XRE-family HTH domain